MEQREIWKRRGEEEAYKGEGDIRRREAEREKEMKTKD